MIGGFCCFFFFKQKTAYEMRISDWSSDVCSSDLVADKTTMNFGSGGGAKSKAWRDIWGAGQGVGSINDVPSVAELVERLRQEYDEAQAALLAARFAPASAAAE